MKKLNAATLFLLTILISATAISQKAETKRFEKEKGKLLLPACAIYGVNDYKKAGLKHIDMPFKNITFITDSAAEVRSVHAGKVYKIFSLDKDYGLVEKYGDYYITYYPLAKPKLKSGDTISQGQPLGKISSEEAPNEINILMSKTTNFVDPYKWFKW